MSVSRSLRSRGAAVAAAAAAVLFIAVGLVATPPGRSVMAVMLPPLSWNVLRYRVRR